MTTFRPQQSNPSRRVRQKADADALQIHVTKYAAKLHSHCHEARIIMCNNFQGAGQAYAAELKFYTTQALPLVKTRFLRLANSSPMAARSPARRSSDGRETSGKKSGEMSRIISAQSPGNGRAVATAMPPNVRQDGSQDNLPCAGRERAMSAPETCEMTRLKSQPRHPKIMNTPTTPTPDLEGLRKAAQEFQPNPHRVPFNGLKPVHDVIVDLRRRKLSYAVITDLLQQHKVKTSRARVAEYGRIVLDGGKKRKRRKRAKIAQAVKIPATPPSAPAVTAQPAPAMPPAIPITNNIQPPKENSAYTSRGPRIANVRMMSPEEKADLDAFLKAKDAPES